MLKVNELMIGDWVKVIDHFEPWLESLYVRVQGLDDTLRPLIETEYQLKGREAWASIRYEPEHIEPILLTEEILKANGFVDGVLPYTLCNSKLMLSMQDCNGFWTFSIYAEETEFCDLMVAYVHGLQHVLRVCGLNELADNFKIE